jgi:CheY-like chemotaxis protein
MRNATVLLVDANQATQSALSQALADAGYRVGTAATGSSAVAVLETLRPDLIVSHAQVHDMDGYELFTRVRKDPTTMDTPFLLLAGRDRPVALAANEAGVNMTVMSGDFTLETVVEKARDILKDATTPPPPAPGPTPGPRGRGGSSATGSPLWIAFDRSPRTSPPGGSFEGSLDVLDLVEVAQTLALGQKTGRLMVSMRAGEGMALFANGRVVHAEFSGRTGEGAFAAIISACQRDPRARFCFNRMEPAEVVLGPRTVSLNVEQLLLSIAVRIDEGESNTAPSLAGCEDG